MAESVLQWPLRATPSLRERFSVLAQKGGGLPGVLTVVEGDQLTHHVGYITVLFFHGISDATSEAIQRADAFDLVPIGIASSAASVARQPAS